MVTVLPERESFGAAFSKALAGAAKSAGEGLAERQKIKKRQKLIEEIEAGSSRAKKMGQDLKGSDQTQDIRQKFIEALPMLEQMKREKTGQDLTPEDLDQAWSMINQVQKLQGQQSQQMASQESDGFTKAKKYAAAGEEQLSKIAMEEGKQGRKESFAREQAGEKSLEEIQDRLQGTELSDMRQEKLQHLFTKEKENQFPPTIIAAAFTKDGELNPLALSQLSEDAQEAVKLLADEVRGVKDTFGSQITGFEVRRFLARLPSLLNTAEGKRRVINDLRMMNKFSTEADQGVLDIVDRYGGPGKISISKAKNIYKKENAQKIKEMRQAFVNPESAEFSELPDASMFAGREIEDPETGKSFKSNGKEWIPQ